MNALSEYLNLGLGALFFKEETYEKMRDDQNPVVKGLILILLVSIIVALVTIVGRALEWSTTPDLSNLKNIVLEEMSRTPSSFPYVNTPEFRQGYDLWWQFFGSMFGVSIVGAVLNVITNPISLVLRWLIFGVVVFVFARLLGGKGNLSQTLGCTALAVAPEMLNAFHVLPYVQVGGVAIWSLICTYLGVKISNQLSPWRAFWATLLPFVAFLFLAILFGCVCVGLPIAISSGGQR